MNLERRTTLIELFAAGLLVLFLWLSLAGNGTLLGGIRLALTLALPLLLLGAAAWAYMAFRTRHTAESAATG